MSVVLLATCCVSHTSPLPSRVWLLICFSSRVCCLLFGLSVFFLLLVLAAFFSAPFFLGQFGVPTIIMALLYCRLFFLSHESNLSFWVLSRATSSSLVLLSSLILFAVVISFRVKRRKGYSPTPREDVTSASCRGESVMARARSSIRTGRATKDSGKKMSSTVRSAHTRYGRLEQEICGTHRPLPLMLLLFCDARLFCKRVLYAVVEIKLELLFVRADSFDSGEESLTSTERAVRAMRATTVNRIENNRSRLGYVDHSQVMRVYFWQQKGREGNADHLIASSSTLRLRSDINVSQIVRG